jgi:hypothetical protein
MDPQLREQALLQWVGDIAAFRGNGQSDRQEKIDALLTALGDGFDDTLAPFIQGKLEQQQTALQAQLDTLAPQVATAEAAATAVLTKGAPVDATPAN